MIQREYACMTSPGEQTVNLIGHKLTGELRGLMFEASVEQRFCNPSDANIELVYRFPLPWGAVLLGVDVEMQGKRLTGAVVEKKEAEARYEEVISDGDAAIILERSRDHSYSLNLGNLAAHEHCTITLRYAQILQFEQRGLRLLIPTVIAPRYGDTQSDGGLMPHQELSHSLTADQSFDLELRLYGGLAQARVASPTHPIGVARGQSAAGSVQTVTLGRRGTLDRDFVLVVDQLEHDSVSIAAQDWVEPRRVAILASFCPRLQVQAIPATAVKILVDCSGSMAGDSMDAAKRALQAIVQQLSTSDRFCLSRFGSYVEHRSRGLWKATETTQIAAQRWIGGLKADLGGTEMEAALTSTFALAHTVSSDILLVTDGEIHAIDSTIESAKSSGHRLFIVGIGSSPAEHHLRRLAEATGGACDFVAPGEAVEPAVLRMFARLRSPQLADLCLEWPEDIVPEWLSPLLPSVFDGDTVNVFAWLNKLPTGEVRLLGKQSGESLARVIGTATLPIQLEAADTLSRMAAANHCQSGRNNHTNNQSLDVTQLAVDYQLVTEKTNFLLVHERPVGEKACDMPEYQRVNSMLPAGWGGLGSVTHSYSVTPSIPAIFRSASPRAYRTTSTDRFDIPAFLRKDVDPPDDQDRPSWAHAEDGSGLTPLGVCEWLRSTPASEWPSSYLGLRQMGIGECLVDWLELVVAKHEGTVFPESQVVEAFLDLMSRSLSSFRDVGWKHAWTPKVRQLFRSTTDESPNQLKGSLGPLQATARRLHSLFAGDQGDQSATKPDDSVVNRMEALLEGMTATKWPDHVFAMDVDLVS